MDISRMQAGDKLKLQGGLEAEVIENIGDGEWLRVRFLVVPGKPADVGLEELCHFTDIVAPIDAGAVAAKPG